ncbi:MAG: AAA family ATPase [Bacillota bacterium]
MLKRLPLGIVSIKELLNEDYLYIDKTMYYKRLIDEGKYFFLSRPRRFGKTLLISTLKEIFKGNKEIFKDQWIYNNYEFEKHPVIHIDFNEINYKEGILKFKKSLINKLVIIGKSYNIEIENDSPKDIFVELIEKLEKINKVVILIDEYDKPMIEYINDFQKAEKNKEFISNFYEVIKAKGDYLNFVLLTGVTKVSKTSIFSKLNNLTDISLSNRYSEMLGITEKELYNYFDKHLINTANKLDITVDQLKLKLKKWYNGYSWYKNTKVYNPYSILNFFVENKFKNYWFETGTPTFLIDMIKKNNYNLSNLEEVEVEEYIFNSYDLKYADITALLFQTGYLTIKENYQFMNMDMYKLVTPNYEVKNSLMNYILKAYTDGNDTKEKVKYINMLKSLINKNIEKFIDLLKSAFASIPYNIYPTKEKYYHSIFVLIMNLLGADVKAEVLTDKGRIDGILEFEDIIYIIEFKTGDAKSGLKQIKEKKYYEKYIDLNKEIFLLSIGGFLDKDIEYVFEKIK